MFVNGLVVVHVETFRTLSVVRAHSIDKLTKRVFFYSPVGGSHCVRFIRGFDLCSYAGFLSNAHFYSLQCFYNFYRLLQGPSRLRRRCLFGSGREILEQIGGTSSLVTLIFKNSWTVSGPKSILQHLCKFCSPSLTFFSILLPQTIYVPLPPNPD